MSRTTRGRHEVAGRRELTPGVVAGGAEVDGVDCKQIEVIEQARRTVDSDLQDARRRLNEHNQKIGTLREELNSGCQAPAAQRAANVA